MTHAYPPGQPGQTPTSPAPTPGPVQPTTTIGQRPTVAQAPAPTGQVVVGDPVDLAHELGELRKLHYTNLAFSGLAMFFAFFAVLFS